MPLHLFRDLERRSIWCTWLVLEKKKVAKGIINAAGFVVSLSFEALWKYFLFSKDHCIDCSRRSSSPAFVDFPSSSPCFIMQKLRREKEQVLIPCVSLSSYNRWLCQARAEDLSDIASLKALYQTGESRVSKPAACVCAPVENEIVTCTSMKG